MSISPVQSNPLPFIQGKYQGTITVSVDQNPSSSAFLIEATGLRISLKNFKGDYLDRMQSTFAEKVIPFPHEFSDMKEVFGNSEARAKYADEKAQDDEKIIKRINFNAKRAYEGNPFTGFAIMENTTEKIIGFVSIGRGYQAGESQSGLILNPNYWGKGYAKEAALLTGALAYAYFRQGYKVGPKNQKEVIKRFTITAKESNTKATQLAEKLGMEKIRELTEKERYTDERSFLYGIDASDVKNALFKWIDPNSLQLNLPPL